MWSKIINLFFQFQHEHRRTQPGHKEAGPTPWPQWNPHPQQHRGPESGDRTSSPPTRKCRQGESIGPSFLATWLHPHRRSPLALYGWRTAGLFKDTYHWTIHSPAHTIRQQPFPSRWRAIGSALLCWSLAKDKQIHGATTARRMWTRSLTNHFNGRIPLWETIKRSHKTSGRIPTVTIARIRL